MIIEWKSFTNTLGKSENSLEFIDLCNAINEAPHILSDPDEYNDPLGKTEYYQFYQSGIEVGFRENFLSHMHFYFFEEEGYQPFLGCLRLGVKKGDSRKRVIELFGEPTASGQEKTDMLLGHINGWLKYKSEEYCLHLQFNEHDRFCRATLMK